jgi:hypothetical protein
MNLCTIFIFILAGCTSIAQAEQVILLDRVIEVTIPSGYCQVGKHPADAEMLRRTTEGIGNSNRILMLFANCKELDDFRLGKRASLDNFGQILVPTYKGQLQALEGFSPAKFITKASGSSVRESFDAGLKKGEARIKEIESSYQSVENLGSLGADDNGLYAAVVLTMTDDTNQVRRILGITGRTLIKELPVSINIYEAYKGSPNLGALLALQKSALAAIVKAND